MSEQTKNSTVEEKNKRSILIAYKILHDALFLFLLFFASAMVSEGILPGVITSQISLSAIMILATLNLVAIFILASTETLRDLKVEIPAQRNNMKKNALPLAFIAILIFNSQFGINIFLNIFIVTVILAIIILLFETFFKTEKNRSDSDL